MAGRGTPPSTPHSPAEAAAAGEATAGGGGRPSRRPSRQAAEAVGGRLQRIAHRRRFLKFTLRARHGLCTS